MGNPARGMTLQYFVGKVDVGLQLGALPVLFDRFMSLLDGKGGVAIAAVRCEQGRQQILVAGFPGAFVVFHESVDVHRFPPLMIRAE